MMVLCSEIVRRSGIGESDRQLWLSRSNSFGRFVGSQVKSSSAPLWIPLLPSFAGS